jgi:histidine triad (HIT) family protein
MIVFGLDVPHAHIHLIPINKSSEMSFSSPKVSLSQEEFQEIAASISIAFEKM